MIDPEKIKLNDQPPPVAIEQIRADDESISPTQTIELGPGKSRLDFYYTALSFVAPEKVRFKYKLEGFDSDWVDGGTRRIASRRCWPRYKSFLERRCCSIPVRARCGRSSGPLSWH